MTKYLLTLALLLSPVLTRAADCQNTQFHLLWPVDVVSGATLPYTTDLRTISTGTQSTGSQSITGTDVFYAVYRDTRRLSAGQASGFSYHFPSIGTYTIQAATTYSGCSYTATLSVRAYRSIIVYIGSFLPEFNLWVAANLKQHQILLHTIIVDDTSLYDRDALVSSIVSNSQMIQQTTKLFINLPSYGIWFDLIQDLPADLQKTIRSQSHYVMSNTDPDLVKKFLAPFLKWSALQQVRVMKSTDFVQMLLELSIGKAFTAGLLVASPLTMDTGGFHYSLSYLLDYLLFQGFPIELAQMMLVLTLVVVILVGIKQVIGLNIFGLWYPILFALALSNIGPTWTMLFFVLALIADMSVRLFAKRVNLLSASKIGLRVLIYTIVTLAGITIAQQTGWMSLSTMTANTETVFLVYVAMLIITTKLPDPEFKKISRRGTIVRFLILSWLMAALLADTTLQYFLLRSPSRLFGFIIITIALGRYMGLQVTEYIRFWPLIRTRITKIFK